MKTAFVFPGQGSQTPGMGKELADNFESARLVFEEVDEALGETLSRIIFEGPDATLTATENAQPAIMATSIAALRVLEKETGLRIGDRASFVAGHSLGEYSALCAAGTFSLADTAKLLRLRGQAMQKAVPEGVGAMAALLGLDMPDAEIVAKLAAADGEICTVANDNAPGQIVLSGHKTAIERAIELAKEKGAKRAILLNVSAPFHCPLMQPASEAMMEALAAMGPSLRAPSVPLVANVTAESVFDNDTIRTLLVQQVESRVRWRESVQYMKAQGVTHIVEIGAGKVLTGLIKRIEPEIATLNVGFPDDIEHYVKAA